MIHKTYDWTCTFLWFAICLTLLILGWSIFYLPYWSSLTIVVVLLALFIITGYIQYIRVLSLKRKFIIAQETFTTIMLVYFSFYYFSGKNEIPTDKVLKGARKKIDDVYRASRYHLTIPLVITALKTFSEISKIKSAVKSEVKNFTATDGFSVENAQIIAIELANLFKKIRQLIDIIDDGVLSGKDFDMLLEEGVYGMEDKENSKGKTVKSSVHQKNKVIKNNVKSGAESINYSVKQRRKKTVPPMQKGKKENNLQ